MKIAKLLVFVLLWAPLILNAQCLNTPEFPFTSDEDDYSWSGNIYPQSEVGGAVSITSVSFYLDNPVFFNGTYSDFEVYIRHTTDTQYPSFGKSWTAMSLGAGDRYYSGPLALTSGRGLYTLNLSSAFAYNGTNNLEVVFACIGGDANAHNFPQEPWFRRTAAYPNYPGNIGYDNFYPFSFEFKSRRQFKILLVINGNQELGASGGPTCGITLPVDLVEFSGKYDKKSGSAELSWITANEINNHYFEIQRRYEGQEYEVIGKVNAGENPRVEQHYSFVDFDLNSSNGKFIYYRLKQVDLDGGIHWSKTQTVSLQSQAEEITAFFNENALNVTFGELASGQLRLINGMGQLIQTAKFNNARTFQMDVAKRPTGIYFLTYKSTNGVQTTIKMFKI